MALEEILVKLLVSLRCFGSDAVFFKALEESECGDLVFFADDSSGSDGLIKPNIPSNQSLKKLCELMDSLRRRDIGVLHHLKIGHGGFLLPKFMQLDLNLGLPVLSILSFCHGFMDSGKIAVYVMHDIVRRHY